MSTHVVGIKPPDEKWKKMKAVYDSCASAGIDLPAEVAKFFNHEPPDDKGVVVIGRSLGSALRSFKGDMVDGFEVFVDELPKDVKIIRFYNSY